MSLPESVFPPLCSYTSIPSMLSCLSLYLCPPPPPLLQSSPISKSIAMSVFNPTMTWVPSLSTSKICCHAWLDSYSVHPPPPHFYKPQAPDRVWHVKGDYLMSVTISCPTLQGFSFLSLHASVSDPYPPEGFLQLLNFLRNAVWDSQNISQEDMLRIPACPPQEAGNKTTSWVRPGS